MGSAILFLPLPARRALHAIRRACPEAELSIERRGPIRVPIRATLVADGETIELVVLTNAELSAELRARRDPSLQPLAALRVERGPWAERFAAITGGELRDERVDPLLRGLALCALVGRLQTEEDEWEGREQEPARLMRWLEGHGAAAALSDVERAWITAPVDALPAAAWDAKMPTALASHAYALGVVDSPNEEDVPALLNALGYLADEKPNLRMRPGAERYLR